jgi:uncharacterized protein YggU (UPF0235/DUF167 family)
MDPWRTSSEGISVALRVTPRGGRDDIDGVETLSDGRSVLKFGSAPSRMAARPTAR